MIRNFPESEFIPTSGYNWENYRYTSPKFRQAHVEVFNHDALTVLHVVVLPHVEYPTPIFGFDVVGSTKTNTVSGLFLDWSPTLIDKSWHDTSHHEQNRILPPWAYIFSNSFIAQRPTEYTNLLTFALLSFDRYLRELRSAVPVTSKFDRQYIIDKQDNYCIEQAANPRTHAALTAHLSSAEHATHFMSNILFPRP